jgi:hypothetical protein
MSRRLIVLIVAAGFGPGCFTTEVVRRPTGIGSAAAINQAARDNPPLEIDYRPGAQPVDLTLQRAKWFVDADRDEVNVIDLGDQKRSIASAQVKSIHTTNHARGAWQGLVAGLLAGALTGGLLGVSDGDDWLFSAKEKALYLGIGFGVLGGFAGTIAGAIVGQQKYFVFDDSP